MKHARSPVFGRMRRLAAIAVTTVAVSLGVAVGSAEASVGALSATLDVEESKPASQRTYGSPATSR